MADELCISICNFLKSLNFHYLESWVKECVDYYQTNNPNILESDLREEVRQQWLLSNLRDMKVSAFPPNLKSQNKTVLTGKYAVQVEAMVDSGKSYYSQLQSIQNIMCENLEVTTSASNEEKATRRCITMNLTDGVQDLHAMEYEAIPVLKLNDPDLLPGFKMIISGPVNCRRGMILLAPKNVVICGGEVDVLAETNTLLPTLCRSLGIADLGLVKKAPTKIFHENRASQSLFADFNNEDDDILLDVAMELDDSKIRNNDLAECLEANNQNVQTACLEERNLTSLSSVQQSLKEEVQFLDEIPLSICNSRPRNHWQPSTVASEIHLPTIASVTNVQSNVTQADNSTRNVQKKMSKKIVATKPFVYLSQIVEEDMARDKLFRVKAVILTLKTKISVKGDTFTLQAKITDGSLAIDVQFASEILEALLGFSPAEMVQMAKEKKKNSAIGERLKTAFIHTQQTLISLNCIMHVQFFASKDMPFVLALDDVTECDLNALRDRKIEST